MDEAIDEILEIPTLNGGSKQAAKLSSMREERKQNSGKKATCESRGMNTKKPTVQTTSVLDIGLPDAKASASSSSVETMNCDSDYFVASGDNMRLRAAGSSKVKPKGCSASSNTVKLPSSHITRQQLSKKEQRLPAIMTKEENTLRKLRMSASRKTADPSLGGLQGMATHRKAAVHVNTCNTVKLPSSHITRQQLSKKEQRLPAIMTKEENTLRKLRMSASRKTAVPSLGGLQGMATHRKAAVHVTGDNITRQHVLLFEFTIIVNLEHLQSERNSGK